MQRVDRNKQLPVPPGLRSHPRLRRSGTDLRDLVRAYVINPHSSAGTSQESGARGNADESGHLAKLPNSSLGSSPDEDPCVPLVESVADICTFRVIERPGSRPDPTPL